MTQFDRICKEFGLRSPEDAAALAASRGVRAAAFRKRLRKMVNNCWLPETVIEAARLTCRWEYDND